MLCISLSHTVKVFPQVLPFLLVKKKNPKPKLNQINLCIYCKSLNDTKQL